MNDVQLAKSGKAGCFGGGDRRGDESFVPIRRGDIYVYIQNLAQDCHFFLRFRGLSVGCWRAVGSTVQKHVRKTAAASFG